MLNEETMGQEAPNVDVMVMEMELEIAKPALSAFVKIQRRYLASLIAEWRELKIEKENANSEL